VARGNATLMILYVELLSHGQMSAKHISSYRVLFTLSPVNALLFILGLMMHMQQHFVCKRPGEYWTIARCKILPPFFPAAPHILRNPNLSAPTIRGHMIHLVENLAIVAAVRSPIR
jgi:hypothetical protein